MIGSRAVGHRSPFVASEWRTQTRALKDRVSPDSAGSNSNDGFDAPGSERQFPKAHARGIGKGVGNRGRGRPLLTFARA